MSPSLAGDAAIALCYHRVRPDDDPVQLSVRPEHFAEHLAVLSSLAQIVPLRQLRATGGGPRVAITFDDGYADNLEVAAPILAAAGAPATFFFTSAAIDGSVDFWWERLDHLVLDVEPSVPQLELDLQGRRVRVDVRTRAGRRRAHALLNRHLLNRTPPEQETILRSVEAQLGGSAQPCEAHRKITDEQVRELISDDLFELGGHTVSHPLLAMLDRGDQAHEIRANRERLSGLVDQPITEFAYPYGHDGAFDQVTVGVLREAGYERAYTTSPGRVVTGGDPYRTPRHTVLDWSGEELAEQVAVWLS